MKRRLSFRSFARLLNLAVFVASLVICSGAFADQGTGYDMNTDPENHILEKPIVPHDHYYPSFMRLTVIAEVMMPDGPPRTPGAGAQAAVDFGTGLISGEIGLAYLTAKTSLLVTDSADGGKNSFTETDHYVGIPVFLKINYIERPRASLSLKLGVEPIISTKDTSKLDVGDSQGQTYNLQRSDTLGVIGFTGAAPMGDDTEFIFDGSYGRGFTNLDGNGAHHGVLAVGLGVRWDL